MDGFGAKEKTEAEASHEKPAKIRGRQPKQTQSPDESEKQSEASNKGKMISGRQPMQKRQKQCIDENEQAEGSSNRKRGRKPMLTSQQRYENKIRSGRNHRRKKAAKYKEFEKKIQELEKEKEERKTSKEVEEELSKIHARADKLEKEMSYESINLNMVRMQNKEVEKLQQNFLNQDYQEDRVESLEYTKLIDDVNVNQYLLKFGQYPDPPWSMTQGFSFGEGTGTNKTKLSSDTVDVNGFTVLKENFLWIQEIFGCYPNIESGLRFCYPALRNCLMNTLAEVYKMAKTEVHTLEDIKHMENGIKDLEFAGLEISWLKALVVNCREKVQGKKGRN
ncbi:hypothetical protein DITRI_Ditri11bG0033700 [Diplodiscus trichospermus]